jgi:hypothetical protein
VTFRRDLISIRLQSYPASLHDNFDNFVAARVRLLRLRILSSQRTTESAELVARTIVDTYLEPNKTFLELREMVNRSIVSCVMSARPAAQNSNRFLINSETRQEAGELLPVGTRR